MNDVAATRSVIVERKLAHKPEKVWRALTQGHLIGECANYRGAGYGWRKFFGALERVVAGLA
jgi:uncharacterized protein YndB with AHSA1/START domain